MGSIAQSSVESPPSGTSLWALARGRMLRNRLMLVCGAVLGLIVLASLLAPWIAPYPYEQIDLKLGAIPPSRAH